MRIDHVLRTRYPALRAGGHASWAHVSGWAQLSGHRQNVSCIVPALEHGSVLAELLPTLSDVLTECGYPWEVIVVDAGSRDETDRVLREWCEVDGFRALMLHGDVGRESTLTIGLAEARGDAAVLLDPASAYPLTLLTRMVILWESGAELVCAMRDPRRGEECVLRSWDPSAPDDAQGLPALNVDTCKLMLIDRRLVDLLLR